MFLFLKRTFKTSEIIISRVFLSGCGWNGGSMIAEHLDYSIIDYNFFFITGCCQAIPVMSGHLTYSKLKNRFRKVNMDLEYNKAFHIGSATFLSGCIWQPTVNLFDTYDFSVVSTVTGLTCGATFFTGLLMTKYLCPSIDIDRKDEKSNIQSYLGVSSSIGGATGLSVATDTSIDNNFMGDYFGITGEYTILESLFIAGTSNACGFLALQTIQNMKKKHGWINNMNTIRNTIQ
jgi:hypothetical protein